MVKHAYNHPHYRAMKRLLKQRHIMCVHCETRRATTPDHLVEVDAGGAWDQTNLAPSCPTCNNRRGAQYGNRKRAQARKYRNANY